MTSDRKKFQLIHSKLGLSFPKTYNLKKVKKIRFQVHFQVRAPWAEMTLKPKNNYRFLKHKSRAFQWYISCQCMKKLIFCHFLFSAPHCTTLHLSSKVLVFWGHVCVCVCVWWPQFSYEIVITWICKTSFAPHCTTLHHTFWFSVVEVSFLPFQLKNWHQLQSDKLSATTFSKWPQFSYEIVITIS